MDTKSKGGRKPLEVPRTQKHIYITDRTHELILAWGASLYGPGRHYSDTIEKMVEVASQHPPTRNDTIKWVPVSKVFDALWGGRKRLQWLEIDAATGRRLRCQRCGGATDVTAIPFAEIVEDVFRFVSKHTDCEEPS